MLVFSLTFTNGYEGSVCTNGYEGSVCQNGFETILALCAVFAYIRKAARVPSETNGYECSVCQNGFEAILAFCGERCEGPNDSRVNGSVVSTEKFSCFRAAANCFTHRRKATRR